MPHGNGFLITRQPNKLEKTVIVLGIARGGTSLVAGMLHALAIPMGDESSPPLFEDELLTRAIQPPRRQRSDGRAIKDFFPGVAATIGQRLQRSKSQRTAAQEIISDYNARFDIWGYKKPSAYEWITAHYREFRNPVFLLIMKDPIAIAVRKNNLYDYETETSIINALKQYEKMMRFLSKNALPAFIFSYEKLMENPAAVIPELCGFLGIPKERAEKAMAFIAKGSDEYNALFNNHMARRKNAIEGHLDVVNPNIIAGWAMNLANPSEAVTITITVNDALLCTVNADSYRSDLIEGGIHSTGRCGFCVNLDKNIPLADSSIIRAFAGENNTELSQSPWVFNNN